MAHNAYGWEDGNFRGMPEKIETKEKLVSTNSNSTLQKKNRLIKLNTKIYLKKLIFDYLSVKCAD